MRSSDTGLLCVSLDVVSVTTSNPVGTSGASGRVGTLSGAACQARCPSSSFCAFRLWSANGRSHPSRFLRPSSWSCSWSWDEHVRQLAAVARRGGNGCSHWREATSCRCSFFSPVLILSIRSALVRCSACVPMQGYATGSLGLVNLAERVAASCSVAPSRRWRWCPSCRPSPVLRYTLVVLLSFWSCQSRLLTAPRLRQSPFSAVGREP